MDDLVSSLSKLNVAYRNELGMLNNAMEVQIALYTEQDRKAGYCHKRLQDTDIQRCDFVENVIK